MRAKFGRYELLRKIAAGGMAEIFLARQWGEGGFFRDVVIKRLFLHLAEHPQALRMFQDEARLLAELCHPNIPQVFELGFVDGYWYIAMEHVAGFSLADICRAGAKLNRAMPLPVALGILIQTCEALHHAHERHDREGRPLRIVHRDVTPHNVMVTLDGVVKVMDFGVAQTAARLEAEQGAVRGTYAYMAPEQVRGLPLDKRADVFGLGVVLYELTTESRLYRGSDIEAMTAIVERDAPLPSSRRADYPAELEAIVMGALTRDRAQRTPSAAHLVLALEQFTLRQQMLCVPRVIARHVRHLYPYERAHEAGMGIALETETGSGAFDLNGKHTGMPADDEQSLLEELRRLGRLGAAVPAPTQEIPVPLRMPQADDGLLELDSEELLDDQDMLLEDELVVEAHPEALGLEQFEEDAELKPVVLLPAPKPNREQSQEGSYVSDLQRRLEQDGDRRRGDE
jgi:serine/threonine protein kinase